jgi:phosphate/sulfate permease
MKKNLLKSIWAVFAGFIFVVILSILTDVLLIKTGLLKQPFHLNSKGFILIIVFYRCLYGIIGSYFTAKFSPNKPMTHAIIGGAIGFVIAILGAVTMWSASPHWYPVSLIITTLPCAWLGAQLFIKQKRYEASKQPNKGYFRA